MDSKVPPHGHHPCIIGHGWALSSGWETMGGGTYWSARSPCGGGGGGGVANYYSGKIGRDEATKRSLIQKQLRLGTMEYSMVP